MQDGKLLTNARAAELATKLSGAYKEARYYLNFKTPIDLVAAAIISAQTRDETVNRLTPNLFSKYRSAKDYSSAKPKELQEEIRSVTFAEKKAENIINTCKVILDKYGGEVPKKMDQLIELPGIGRKTANTIMINAYGIVEGIPVDTWVIKLSYRLGLSMETNPDKIEQDLMGKIPKPLWKKFAYVMKVHGKTLCKDVPICSKCPVNSICPKNGVKEKI